LSGIGVLLLLFIFCLCSINKKRKNFNKYMDIYKEWEKRAFMQHKVHYLTAAGGGGYRGSLAPVQYPAGGLRRGLAGNRSADNGPPYPKGWAGFTEIRL
jgi:hypothetical protein